MRCNSIIRRLPAASIITALTLLAFVALVAHAQDQPKQAPTGRIVPTIFIYVDYNKQMHANISSVEDMVDHLEENVQQRISERGYAAAIIFDRKDFKKSENHYLLTIYLDDYHGGPRKTAYLHYEFSGPGIPLLISDRELNTVKGSGKLVRVLAKELADIIDSRLQTGKSK